MKITNKALTGVVSAACSLVVASVAGAQTMTTTPTPETMMTTDAAFDNHMHSQLLVSPAQLWQFDGLSSGFSLGMATGTNTMINDTDLTATTMRATGLYTIAPIGLKAGLDIEYVDADFEVDSDLADEETNATTWRVSPTLVYEVGLVSLGAQANYKAVETELKQDGVTDDQDTDYMTYTVGATHKSEAMEIGAVLNTEKVDMDAGILDPSSLTIHGRYAVMNDFAVGGMLSSTFWSTIDNDELGELDVTDQYGVAATVEWSPEVVRLEGLVGYDLPFYDGDENALVSDQLATIGTWRTYLGADYKFNNIASVGASVDYRFGTDETAEGEDLEVNTLAFAVRGNYAF